MAVIFREKNPTDPRLQTYEACSDLVWQTRTLISRYLGDMGFSPIAVDASEKSAEYHFKRRSDRQWASIKTVLCSNPLELGVELEASEEIVRKIKSELIDLVDEYYIKHPLN